jgi:hypothetical protein
MMKCFTKAHSHLSARLLMMRRFTVDEAGAGPRLGCDGEALHHLHAASAASTAGEHR